MTWLIAATVVLLVGSTVRADMGAPWPISRRVPVRITITADAPPPGVGLLLVPNDPGSLRHSGPRAMPTGLPVILESDGRRFFFDVYSVPAETHAQFANPRPGFDGSNTNTGDRHHVGGVRFVGGLSVFDGRAVIEEAYHVERQGESMHLRKVSDNTPSWWQSGTCSLCVLAVPIGVIWLGVRLARSRSGRSSEGGT